MVDRILGHLDARLVTLMDDEVWFQLARSFQNLA